jgi:hypothetical protein
VPSKQSLPAFNSSNFLSNCEAMIFLVFISFQLQIITENVRFDCWRIHSVFIPCFFCLDIFSLRVVFKSALVESICWNSSVWAGSKYQNVTVHICAVLKSEYYLLRFVVKTKYRSKQRTHSGFFDSICGSHCILGWIEREVFQELRVAWGLKNLVLEPVNPIRNIFVFGYGWPLSLGPRRLANLYENGRGFEKKKNS